jgi:hypothetical protein
MTVTNTNRFSVGAAGPHWNPVDALNIDLDVWLQDPSSINNAVDFSSAGKFYVWTPPVDTPLAGIRIVMTGGANDSIVRFAGYSPLREQEAQSSDPVNYKRLILNTGPQFKIDAGTMMEFTFALPMGSKFGLIVETGGVVSHELQWMLGV